jgi:hypothetical protein
MINALTDPVMRQRLPERLGEIHRLLKQNTAERAADAVLQCMK